MNSNSSLLTADERQMLEQSVLRAPPARGAIRQPRTATSRFVDRDVGLSGTEVMFFGAALVGFGAYHSLYAEAFEAASAKLNWIIGGINTLVLLISSLTMVLAIHFAKTGADGKLIVVAWRLTAGAWQPAFWCSRPTSTTPTIKKT